MDEHELLEIGNKAVNQAQKLGADEAEIFLYMENQTNVEFVGGIFASRSGAVKGLRGAFVRIAGPWIKKKGLPKITSGIKAGVGVRAIVKKAIGFSSVSSVEEKRIFEAVEEATKTAKMRPPDPNWVSLPEGKKPLGEGGVFDKKFLELDVEKLLELCADGCVIIGDFDRRIIQAIGSISAVSIAGGIVNTNGIETFDKGTAFTAFFYAKAKSGAEEVSGGDFLMSRYYTENLQPIAVSASKRTIESLGKKALPQKYGGPVVFENESWNELFSVIFTSGISALNIQESRSVYKGKIGNRVADESVSILDDGTLPEGFGTTKNDDEGVPRQKTPIIEKGLLTNILYDNYTAKREKRESTGNASRQGRATAAYANQPTIRPSNLVLLPSKGSLQDLMSELKDGVLIRGSLIGALHSNVITGDFSVTADNAFKIEDGKVAFPLKPCTVAGNLYEALNHVTTIGSDSKSFGNFICPSVIVDKIVVST
jgi:PmbA protein